MRLAATFSMLAAMLMASVGVAQADGVCRNGGPELAAARTKLASAPKSLPARIALADALVDANCFHEAVHTLEDGEEMHSRNADLAAKLRNTRSLVSEQEYFDGKDQAEIAARVSRNLLRCSKLADVTACDEALKLKPGDAEILLARGDALLKASRPVDAEASYRRAGESTPGDPRIAIQLAAARAQRQSLRAQCLERSDDAALLACQGALSKGESSEFDVHSRMALLYQQRNQPAASLASYVAAQTLRPGDLGIASGVVALTNGAGASDAVSLDARGSALLSLRRGREALQTLRQAQRLAPSIPNLRTRIAQAEAFVASDAVASTVQLASQPAAPVSVARKYSNAAEASRSR